MSQEEKQALRRAKKAAKKGKQVQNEVVPEVVAEPANPATAIPNENPTASVPDETSVEVSVPAKLTKEGKESMNRSSQQKFELSKKRIKV